MIMDRKKVRNQKVEPCNSYFDLARFGDPKIGFGPDFVGFDPGASRFQFSKFLTVLARKMKANLCEHPCRPIGLFKCEF
jgi:hypothetical protein